MTVTDGYPIPRIDECLHSLDYPLIFSSLDCNWGTWQFPLHPDDIDKSTFTYPYRTFRYTGMLFGLKNSPATFQRDVDVVLSSVKWQVDLIYIDDIINFSHSIEDHLRLLLHL